MGAQIYSSTYMRSHTIPYGWNELDLSRLNAVDDTWAEYGMDAAELFLLGA